MAANNIYSVHVSDIPEHERIILKLIFSVSQQTRGRAHGYIVTDEPAADFVIGSLRPQPRAGRLATLAVADRQDPGAPAALQRPLIATRVLAALDAVVAQTGAAASLAAQAPDAEPGRPATTAPPQQPRRVPPVIAFNISEEEASELAIVDDETLANPANRASAAPYDAREPDPPSYAVGFAPAEVRPLHTARGRSATPARALVVDDSPSVRKQIELELEFFHVEADYAADAAEAKRLLAANRYDIAFLDVVLPDSDGFRICRQVKAGNRNTTVIMLTGKASHADKVRGSLAGCDAYLVKPVGRMTFQNTVKGRLEIAARATAMGA